MIFKRGLFALVTLALFFCAVEGLLALVGVEPLAAERDPFAPGRSRVYELDAARAVWRTRPAAVVHSFHAQEFAARKPPGGYRIFVIGGSSAFGFPWGASVAFPNLLGAALAESVPERPIETINAAAMSYGSHRLRILAGELWDYEPDAIVIYSGHNEFVERRFYRDRLATRAAGATLGALLDRWRLYALLARVRRELAPATSALPVPGEQTTGELLGLDVVREDATDVGPAEAAAVRATFADNLRAIIDEARRRSVAVVLCTVPANLRDWRPNQSVFGPDIDAGGRAQVRELLARAENLLAAGDAAAAVAELERACAIAPRHAESAFRLARAYEALGRFDDADRAYRIARDADAQPSRARGDINDEIRSLGLLPGVILVDVERAFVDASPHGLLGFSLFEDYVHPKPAGHRRIAQEVWRAVLAGGLLGPGRVADPAAFDRALARIGARDDAVPRSESAPEAAAGRATVRQLFNLAIVLENQGLLPEALEKYREVLRREEGHHLARYGLARLLVEQGRFVEAEGEYRVALETARGEAMHASVLLGLGDAVRAQRRLPEAIALYGEATAVDPRYAPAWGRLGGTLSEAGRHAEAESAFRRALDLDPRDVEALAGSGFALLLQAEIEPALARFDAALAVRPDHVAARGGRAAALVELGRLDEAEQLFLELLREEPANAMARGGLAIIERRRTGGR